MVDETTPQNLLLEVYDADLGKVDIKPESYDDNIFYRNFLQDDLLIILFRTTCWARRS